MAEKKFNVKKCDCCDSDIHIHGDCHPPIIDVETPESGISYDNLINKPKINGEVVKGDKTGDELGLVDKTTESNQVYATDDEGKPTTIPYSTEPSENSIVRRNENGEILVYETPVDNNAAASKKYIDDKIKDALDKAVEFKGILDDQTLLPTEGNRNGDMYWIKEFIRPVPPGIMEGVSGTAIYNDALGTFEFENDETYRPDGRTITLDNNGALAVKLSEEPNNSIVVKEDGLHVDVSHIEEKISTEVGKRLRFDDNAIQLLNDNNDVISEVQTAFVFEQGRSSDTWVIVHNLNKYPSVVVVDSAGNSQETAVEYNTKNKLTIKLNASFSGKAFLN